MAAKDYTGQICGCWKVLERDKNPKSKSHETFWICECQNCGQIKSVRKTDLDKAPLSCNYCKGEKHNLRNWSIGDRFGLLTIVARGKDARYVKVQCDCGSDPFEVRLDHLKGQNHSYTISCGCAKETAGEYQIRHILENANVDFQSQYRVQNDNGEWMIFDFVIFNSDKQIIQCIEFHGEQHYKPIEYFGGEEAYNHQVIRDNRKREWCNMHHIKLIEIPYTELNNINPKKVLPYSEIK